MSLNGKTSRSGEYYGRMHVKKEEEVKRTSPKPSMTIDTFILQSPISHLG
jgi:hypothetical protein